MKTESNRTNPVTPSFIQFLNNSNDYTKTIDNLRRLELPPEIMAQYLTFMQSAPVPVIFVDRNETILFTNKTIEFKLGKNQSELIGHSISDVIPLRLNEGDKQAIIDEVRLNNHWNGRLSYIDNENNTKRSWIKVTRFENPPYAPTYGILFFDTDSVNYRDFSDHSLTYYDTKTFLPNFNQFAFDINQMARKRDSDVKGLALIRCHNLSEITVHYSRKIMDEVTNTMIRRIKKALPSGYYLYRLSRDVFAVFCSKCKNEASFKELIEELYQTLLTPLSIDSKKIFLTIEMGVVFYPTQVLELTDLLLSAEICLNQRDSTRITYYSEEMSNDYTLTLQTIEKMQSAFEDNKIKVLYQPIMDQNGNLEAAEALLRWRDEELGAVSPLVIIKGAKEYGHIHKLTTWILDKVVEDRLFDHIPITINLDAVQLTNDLFLSDIKNLVATKALNPHQIVFEITEHISLNCSSNALNILSELKSMGFRLALDDFGSGYSDFNLLTEAAFDILKVDATFIMGIKEEPKKEIVLKHILQLAKELGLLTCFEGIESQVELTYARELGSDCLQGFYFSHALSFADFTNKYL